MKIVYSPLAIANLRAISAYLRPRSPQGAKRVRAAILDGVALLALFPRAGTPQTVEGVRKIVTRKYRYLIYYTIDEDADEILVAAIQHAAQQREFSNQ